MQGAARSLLHRSASSISDGLSSSTCSVRSTQPIGVSSAYLSALEHGKRGRPGWHLIQRIFEYFSREHGTRTAIIRLNYATELHYGVLVDLAQKVFRNEPISLTTGYFNTIWQRDAIVGSTAS